MVGVTTLTFFLIHFVPGDPIEILLGEQASQIDKAALRAELGLDKPLGEQYTNFYKGLAKLDLGVSLQSRRSVSDEILERLPATIELTIVAMCMAIMLGLPLGVISSVRKRSWIEKLVNGYSLLAISSPSFWIAPLLVWFFSIQLDLFPVSGRGEIWSVVLPALSLALQLSAVLTQTTKTSMNDVIHEDYVRAARAKGAKPSTIYFKHALSNAIMPVITVMGLQFGALLTGAVIVETVFDWPGIGLLLFQAIQQRNFPLVQGCVLVIALTYVLVNLVTDLMYAYANPRVRFS
jgi:peptide/nickel transport system permease protein